MAGTDQQTNIAQAIQEVSDRAQLLVREEIELAKAEVTEKVTKLIRGAVIAGAAGFFVLAALLLILHGLSWLAWWAIPFPGDTQYFWGFFTIAAVLLILGGLAGFLAARAFKAGTPPAPQMAIQEAKLIKETVQSEHPERTI
jgi:uncharacterized membrane protein YqjE